MCRSEENAEVSVLSCHGYVGSEVCTQIVGPPKKVPLSAKAFVPAIHAVLNIKFFLVLILLHPTDDAMLTG